MNLEQNKQNKHRWTPGWDACAAFLLPAALLLLAYVCLGVYPFGQKSLLLVDMHNEYIDYFAYLNRTIRGEGSFMRSWEMGMGLNLMGLIAFYTASALNVLLLLVPLEWLTEAVLALTLLKVGLCGLTFRWYARHALQASRWLAVAASLAYALCGYNLAYSSNIMWLDGVAMLPLVCLGAEQLLRENRCRLFIGSLIYIFLSSYYIGYMIGIFVFLYFTVRCFCLEYSVVEYWGKLKWFLGSALLAAACCAFLLLPAFLELRDGQTGMWQVTASWRLEPGPLQLVEKLLPGSYDSLTDDGLPNLYTTVGAVFALGLFFGAKGIARREKTLMAALLGFLVLSFCSGWLDLAWHAFEDPTWFPARYSFVFSFLLLHLALRGVAQAKAGFSKPVLVWAAALPLFFGAMGLRGEGGAVMKTALLGALLAAAYAGLLLLYRRGQAGLAAVLVLLLLAAESGANSIWTVQGMDAEFGYKTRQSYTGFRQLFAPAVAWVDHHDEGVSRMEVVQQRNANGGMALGYRGISHYSTTTDQSLNTLLRALGYNTGTINELRFAPTTPLTNGLLGIRYTASTEAMGAGYTLAATEGAVQIYQNESAFPLAFAADAAALNWAGDATDPFRFQNDWLEALSGGAQPAFLALETTLTLQNMERADEESTVIYRQQQADLPGVIIYTVHNPTGYPAYAFLPVDRRRFAQATAAANNGPEKRELGYRANTILALGAGETAQLRLHVESGPVRLRGEYFYALDLQAAQEAATRAEASAMAFSRFDDTYISGRVTAPPQGGALVTTFPSDRGWRIWVDGQKTRPERFAGVFLALPLNGGEHQITMRYTPPGFAAGCVVSGCAIGGWLLRNWQKRRQQSKNRI